MKQSFIVSETSLLLRGFSTSAPAWAILQRIEGSYILSRRLVPIFAHFLVENNNHTAALKPILQANLRKQQRAILR